MKTFIYIIGLILISGCAGKNITASSDTLPKIKLKSKTIDTAFKPYRLASDYMVTDTGYFDFGLGDGVYAVLKRNNKLMDTIDKGYSLQPIDNASFVYYTIKGAGLLNKERSNSRYKRSISADIGDCIIINGANKINVSKKAPDFGWFANPSIINHRIYYWQVKAIDKNGNSKISAAEFNPATGLTKSYYLFNDYMETDDGGYFPQAFNENGRIIFKFNDEKKYEFSSDFNLKY